jgi:hypothetical protein
VAPTCLVIGPFEGVWETGADMYPPDPSLQCHGGRPPPPAHNHLTCWLQPTLRPIPHGRQAGRISGRDWVRRPPTYHTSGNFRGDHMTWRGNLLHRSVGGRRLELRVYRAPITPRSLLSEVSGSWEGAAEVAKWKKEAYGRSPAFVKPAGHLEVAAGPGSELASKLLVSAAGGAACLVAAWTGSRRGYRYLAGFPS